MHQIVALALFLVLTVRGAPDALVTPPQRIAYVLGGITMCVAIFMVLHALIYFGARTAQLKETPASFWATRLNYLTFAILLVVFTLNMKHQRASLTLGTSFRAAVIPDEASAKRESGTGAAFGWGKRIDSGSTFRKDEIESGAIIVLNASMQMPQDRFIAL